MIPTKLPPPRDASAEVTALIETLHRAGQRLEELTAGEVDAVATHDGRAYMLPSAQALLRSSEAAKKAAILNALPAHIALIDTHGFIVSVNEAWHRFKVLNPVQCLGHGVGVNYLETCDRARGPGAAEAREAAAGIRSVLTGATKSYSIEYPCDTPGRRRWFLMTVTPLGESRPGGAVVMHLDITEKELAAEEQREVRQLLDNIVENIPTAVQVKSVRDGLRIQLWNKAAEAMYGLSASEAIGRNVHDLWPKAEADFMQAADQSLVDSGRMQDYPDRVAKTRTRGDIRVHMRKVALLDAEGRTTHLLVIADDITTQLADQSRLRESEARFRGLTTLSADWYWEQDEEHRFVSFSGGERDGQWGDDMEKALGQRRWELHGVAPVSGSWDAHKELLEARAPFFDFEYQRILPNGTIKYVAASGEPLFDAAGRFTGYRGVATDITKRKRGEQELIASEERTRSIVELALDAVVVMDATGRIVDWNPQAERTFGWSRDQVAGMLLTETIIPSQHREGHTRGLHAFLETGTGPILGTRREITALHRDGHEFPVELAVSPVRLADAWVFSAFIRDLTRRKEAERKITRLNRVYAVLSGINALIVRVRDRDELFKEACRIAVEHGRFVGAWIGILDRPGMRIIPAASSGIDAAFFANIHDRLSLLDDAPGGHGAAATAFRGKRAVVVNDVQADPFVVHKREHADNGIRAIVSLPLLIDGEPVGVFSLHAADAGVFDETELKLLSELTGDIAYAINYIEKQERLDYLAFYDVLTGLANRSLFLERVAQYIRSAATGKHGLALFLLDIERFKSINDSLGQPAGDALLKQVAEWLTREAGDASLITRLGADHFAVVLPEIKAGGSVTRLVEKALKRFLEHPFQVDDDVFRLALKIGVALHPEDGGNADTLLKHAEAALKAAKASGDRYRFYTQSMTEASTGTLTLENQLRQAIDRREFVLHFQPKVNLASGELTGAEALIRWNDPRTGLVPPGRFIPVLEQTGMIHEVGRWALQTAVEEYRRWRAAGLPAVPIAVNVSPLQLRSRGFIEEVRSAIGIDPHAAAGLELEITESLIMEDVKHSITSLQEIRAMGVRIAIDDFGTGFSSLSYLSKLPVDTLKIDRSFVVDMTTGLQGRSLVSTIITLAHSLKLTVVAEGVETEEQAGLLRDLCCDEVQGYLFGRPVPTAEFESLRLARP